MDADRVIAARRMLPPPSWVELPLANKVAAIVMSASFFSFWSVTAATRRGLTFLLSVATVVLVTAAVAYRFRKSAAAAFRPFRLPPPVRRWRRSEAARLGVDGIAFGAADFVRYREIVSVSREGGYLVLEVGRPGPLVLAVAPDDWIRAEEAVERGRQAHPRVPVEDELEAILRRGSESEDDWRAHIDALRDGAAYRTADLPRAGLLRVVRDVDADVSAREAACILLAREAEPQERAALRAIRTETAHPRLRVALEAIDESDALCEVTDEPRPPSRYPASTA